MKMKQTQFVTEIFDLASMEELRSAAVGEPCLLILHDGAFTESPDLRGFLADAPYMTALAADQPSAELAAQFDLVISPDGVREYTDALFKDMTKKRAAEITACFVKARKGSAAEVLEAESRAFFRLVAEITGGNADV
jgi:hypothetical protein